MEVAGVVMGHSEAQGSGYLPASRGIFTVLKTDTGILASAGKYLLCLVK